MFLSCTVKKEDVKKHYNTLKNFGYGSDEYYFKRRTEQLFVFANSMPHSSRILNLGCGDGKFSKFLGAHGFLNIVDADISILLLRMNKGNKKVLADAEMLSFKEKVFDAVIMTDVIEHLRDRKRVMAETFRVLKNEGMVFITYPNPLWVPIFNFLGSIGAKIDAKDNRVSHEEFEREMNKLFEIESFKTIMIMSKLPPKALLVFERMEKSLPENFMNRFGFMYVYILRKLPKKLWYQH